MTPAMPEPATRCPWCGTEDFYVRYHDEEWGVPCHDERTLFEFLILEGAQAGLSWSTILKKREGYRRAFAGFDVEQVARFTQADAARLMQDAGIVRNRLKIAAAITNAQAVLKLHEQGRTLEQTLWQFVEGRPILNHWQSLSQIPAVTPLAEKISKELKRLGFRFVGATILYAHMQATGMVNDHLVSCFRWADLHTKK